MSLKYLVSKLTIYFNVHSTSNTSVLIFGKESVSADTKDFIKVSGKSTPSDCLDHILNHLDTSLSNDIGVVMSSCHDLNCSQQSTQWPAVVCRETVLQLLQEIISKKNANWSLITKKKCVSRYIGPITLILLFETLAFPLQYLYMKPTTLVRRTIFGILHQYHPLNIESLFWYCQSLYMPQRRQYSFLVV